MTDIQKAEIAVEEQNSTIEVETTSAAVEPTQATSEQATADQTVIESANTETTTDPMGAEAEKATTDPTETVETETTLETAETATSADPTETVETETTLETAETATSTVPTIAETATSADPTIAETATTPIATTRCEPSFEERAAAMGKGELLDTFAQLLSTRAAEELRDEAETVKTLFYRLRYAEVEALRKAYIEANGSDSGFEVEADPMEDRLKDLLAEYRRGRDAALAEIEKAKEENLALRLAIIAKVRSLITSEEKLNTTFARFRDLQSCWKEAGQVPQPKVREVWESYNLAVEQFYDYVKINNELRDLDWRRNLEQKTSLCEAAEALIKEESIIEASRKLQELHEQWREVGPVAREYKEALWERFKAASTEINRRHQAYFDNLKSEQMANLERKRSLCEEVEAIVAEEIVSLKAWTRASERIAELQAAWRETGFATKKENARIYERFREACNLFFERKRSFFASMREGQQTALRLKEELCEAAERLAESDDWTAATEQLIALQERWKTAGTVAHRQADAVWKRFRAACDRFFERKSAHFAELGNAYNENLQRKLALLDEIDATQTLEKGMATIKEFQRRWGEIGFVPIRQKEELQKRYKEAIDRLFGILRSGDKERSMSRFKERMSSLRQAGTRRVQSERERLVAKLRQIEQEVATLENNIGFFARSKGADALRAEVEQKIAKAKREMADVVAKVKMIDSEE